MVEQLADSKLFVSLCRDRRGHYPFVFISFISRKAEEQNLSPNHMVCGNTRFFKSLATTLDVAQGFPLLTEGAVRGVFFAPLMKKGATWEL
jgi:hypothetical protein